MQKKKGNVKLETEIGVIVATSKGATVLEEKGIYIYIYSLLAPLQEYS